MCTSLSQLPMLYSCACAQTRGSFAVADSKDDGDGGSVATEASIQSTNELKPLARDFHVSVSRMILLF